MPSHVAQIIETYASNLDISLSLHVNQLQKLICLCFKLIKCRISWLIKIIDGNVLKAGAS